MVFVNALALSSFSSRKPFSFLQFLSASDSDPLSPSESALRDHLFERGVNLNVSSKPRQFRDSYAELCRLVATRRCVGIHWVSPNSLQLFFDSSALVTITLSHQSCEVVRLVVDGSYCQHIDHLDLAVFSRQRQGPIALFLPDKVRLVSFERGQPAPAMGRPHAGIVGSGFTVGVRHLVTLGDDCIHVAAVHPGARLEGLTAAPIACQGKLIHAQASAVHPDTFHTVESVDRPSARRLALLLFRETLRQRDGQAEDSAGAQGGEDAFVQLETALELLDIDPTAARAASPGALDEGPADTSEAPILCVATYAIRGAGVALTRLIPIPADPVHPGAVAWAPHERTLLLGLANRQIVAVQMATGECIAFPPVTRRPPRAIGWHPHGGLVAVCSEDEVALCDCALQPLPVQTIATRPGAAAQETLDLHAELGHAARVCAFEWAPAQSADSNSGERAGAAHHAVVVLDRGPIIVLRVELGLLSLGGARSVEIVREHLAQGRLAAAVALVRALDNPAVQYLGLQAVIDALLRDASPEAQGLMEGLLFGLWPRFAALSDYRGALAALFKRYFYLLLRRRLFEKAFFVAHTLGARELFWDLHTWSARACPEIAAIALAHARAEGAELRDVLLDLREQHRLHDRIRRAAPLNAEALAREMDGPVPLGAEQQQQLGLWAEAQGTVEHLEFAQRLYNLFHLHGASENIVVLLKCLRTPLDPNAEEDLTLARRIDL